VRLRRSYSDNPSSYPAVLQFRFAVGIRHPSLGSSERVTAHDGAPLGSQSYQRGSGSFPSRQTSNVPSFRTCARYTSQQTSLISVRRAFGILTRSLRIQQRLFVFENSVIWGLFWLSEPGPRPCDIKPRRGFSFQTPALRLRCGPRCCLVGPVASHVR
jgi:hypothetical protein